MKQLRFWLIFSLILWLALFAGTPSTRADAGTRTMPNSLEPLTTDDVTSFVDAFVAENMAAAHVPGLVITVVYEGEVVLSKGYGLADIETGRPMTAQTNLRAGSVSKPVTSAAVLQMVAQGQMALDAPVSDYLPNLLLADEFGEAGTVAQFLTLQGGYADAVVQTHAPTLAEWQPLADYLQDNLPARVLPPGQVYSYNSWEHGLLGQAMAEVRERPFDQVMSEVLFQPLGMARSTFTQPLPEPIAQNLATGYAFADGAYEIVPLDYVNLSPGVALVTTGEDMGRFMLALLNDGLMDGEQVLAATTVAGLLNRQEEVDARSRGRTYGLSEVTLGERKVLYHDGNGIGQANRLILAPEHDLGIFLSTNHRPLGHDASGTPALAFIKELGTAVLERYIPVTPVEGEPLPSLEDAEKRYGRYTGHYRLAGTPQQDFFKLGAMMDNVNVSDNGDGRLTIGSRQYREVEPLVFQSETNPNFFVIFVEDDAGEVAWLTFGGTGSYAKVHWYETPTFQIGLVAVIFIISFLVVVAVPFSRHRYWLVWTMSLLNILFLAGVTWMMLQADLILFFKTIPLTTRLLFLLPWLSGVLTLTLPFVLASLWRNRATARMRLLYGLNSIVAIGFIWFVYYWHLY